MGAENLASTGIRSPHRLRPRESLNRLRYPGPLTVLVLLWKFVAYVAIIIRVKAEKILRTDGLADRDYK
jgi:hypothetical protein